MLQAFDQEEMTLEQEAQAKGAEGGNGGRRGCVGGGGGRRDGSGSAAAGGMMIDPDQMDDDDQEGVDPVGAGLEEILRSVPSCDDVFLQRLRGTVPDPSSTSSSSSSFSLSFSLEGQGRGGLGGVTGGNAPTATTRRAGARAITDKAFLPLPATALVTTSGASPSPSPGASAAAGVTNWDDSFQVANCLYAFRDLLNLQVNPLHLLTPHNPTYTLAIFRALKLTQPLILFRLFTLS